MVDKSMFNYQDGQILVLTTKHRKTENKTRKMCLKTRTKFTFPHSLRHIDQNSLCIIKNNL